MWCIEGIIIWLVKWFVVNWLWLGTCVAPCPSNVCWKGSLHSHNKVKWLIHYSFVHLINNRIWTFISVDEIICKLEWPWSRASWDLNFYLSDLNSMCRWYLVAFLNETPRWLVIGVWFGEDRRTTIINIYVSKWLDYIFKKFNYSILNNKHNLETYVSIQKSTNMYFQ